jgi:hypothetical protein
MRTYRVIAPVLAALLVAGCAGNEPGKPVAGDPTTEAPTTTTTTTSSSAPASSVDRPKPLDMGAVDICQVLAGMPVKQFGLDGDRPPTGGDSSIFPGAKDCFAGGIQANLGLSLVAVADQGAAEFLDGTRAEVTDTEAAGYPLHVLKPADPNSCFGVLDVADGQLLYLSYGLNMLGEDPVTPQVQLCQTVPAIAAAALAQLGA